MVVSQKQRDIYPLRPQYSYGSENVNEFERVAFIRSSIVTNMVNAGTILPCYIGGIS